MNRFTIYCTEEQTKKALKLGAPIMNFGYGDLGEAEDEILKLNKQAVIKRNEDNSITVGQIPTAEEVIGWLEEQGVLMQVEPINGTHYYWLLCTKELTEKPDRYSWVTQYVTPDYKEIPSRKEAILSAIDAALDYLIKK